MKTWQQKSNYFKTLNIIISVIKRVQYNMNTDLIVEFNYQQLLLNIFLSEINWSLLFKEKLIFHVKRQWVGLYSTAPDI